MTNEPKYDEDVVNLGYLNRVIDNTEETINREYENVSRHYGSQPTPPYYKGDTWVDGNIVYTCINTRKIGTYQSSDWTTESGATELATKKNQVFLRQPSNYNAGDMWILQSDTDHKAGKKGEMLITTAGRAVYDEGDWVNMLAYGSIASINEVANNLNEAINRINVTEEAISDGIIITFYQATLPEAKHIGDLWYVTDINEDYVKGKIYRYSGTDWQLLDDPDITKAFEEANEARLVADGKIQSFYSEEEPTKDVGVGDLWIDVNDNNKLYRYNGTNWIAVYDTRIDTLEINVETVTERVVTVETDQGRINQKVTEVTTRVGVVETDVTNLDSKVNNEVSNLQSQIDGQIQFWNGAEIPTTNNYPATEWSTEEVKNNHRADIYTVIEDIDGELKQGKSYRFDKVGTNWVWVELTDNELSAVQALAQSKARVFTTTPKPPYNVGDLWIKDQELYECKTARDRNGVFAQSDWQKATKYTDDTIANLANITANSALDGVNNITTTQATKEGTEIKIDDSAEEPILELELDGKSTQATRSGKNKFDLAKVNTSNIVVLNNTGFNLVNAWATQIINNTNLIQMLKPSTTYTCYSKAKVKDRPSYTSTSNHNLVLILNKDGVAPKQLSVIDKTLDIEQISVKTFTTPDNLDGWSILGYTFHGNNNGSTTYTATGEIDVSEIMLVEGTYTADNFPDFELYGASPSPEFPSEIKSVGDDVNLFDINEVTYRGGDTDVVIENNKIVLTATGTVGAQMAQKFIDNLNANENYTFSFKAKKTVLGTDGLSVINIIVYGSNDGSTYTVLKALQNPVPVENKEYYFQETFTGYTSYRFYIYNNSSTPVTVGEQTKYYDIKFQKGTVATPYSEYGKGTVTIEQRGKNKFCITQNSGTYDELIFTKIDNNTFRVQGTTGNNARSIRLTNIYPELLQNNKYTYSVQVLDGIFVGSIPIAIYNSDNTVRYNYFNLYSNITEQTNTIIANKGIHSWNYYIGANLTVDVTLRIQFEENSTATDYEPYFSKDYVLQTAPLRSLPNGTKDTIEEDGIHRRVGSVVFDGSENWAMYGSQPVYYISQNDMKNTYAVGLISDYFTPKYADSVAVMNSGTFMSQNNKILYFKNINTSTLAEWKTWLQQNPITVIYELSEEVVEPFTDEQLEVIQSIETNLYTQYFNCDANMRITYVRNNGLADMYETKDSATRKYTETEQKIAELNIDVGGISATVGDVTTKLKNDYMTTDQIEAETDTIKKDVDVIKKQQASVELTSKGLKVQIDSINNNGVKVVKNTLVDIDEEGIKVSKGSEFNSLLDDTGVYLKSYDKEIASYTKDGATMYNLTVQNEAIIGNLRALSVEVDGEKRTHIHWIGG